MTYNELGKTGLRVSNLSFGASSLGGVFHSAREEEAIRAVHTAIERGTCPVDALINKVVSPEDAPAAMQQWAEAPGKVFRILVRF